jgi:DNA-binding IclR family transcriptional regulator
MRQSRMAESCQLTSSILGDCKSGSSTMDADQELKSLKRGLSVLMLLGAHRTMSISEAARRLDLPRTTAERIMVTLERERFIERAPGSKRYTLAMRVLALAEGFSAEDRLVQTGTPLLFETTREIGWPLAIAVDAGETMSVRVTTDPATALGLHKRHVGSEIAMAGSSSGVVHLAFLDDAEREEKIALLACSDDPFQKLARDRKALESYLSDARRDGFSIGPDLGSERALSVPIFDHGRVRAILLMMYIARGVPPGLLVTRFAPQLKSLARSIENAAFGSPTKRSA